jgi:hypothetical protein
VYVVRTDTLFLEQAFASPPATANDSERLH